MHGGFFTGAAYLLRGIRWLTRPRLRQFVLVPLLINMVLFGAAIWWGSSEFGAFLDWLLAYLPAWLDWLRWLLWPLFAAVVLLLCFYTFSLMANLIASPFNGLLAERVEDLASPGTIRPAGRPWVREMAAAPLGELRKLGYFLLRAIPLLLLFFIPGVNALATVTWLAFSAWMLALQYLDYPLGNHAVSFVRQRRFFAKRRMQVLGFGSAVMLLTLVPVVNFIVVPAAVIGATLFWVDVKDSVSMT